MVYKRFSLFLAIRLVVVCAAVVAALFRQRQRALIVFVIDASESMGEGSLARMKAAKGAALALLTAAYQNRDQMALVAFREQQAQVLLRPTSSVLLAQQQLRTLPLGGATPFADGLWQAWQLIRTERQKQPSIEPLLVIVPAPEAVEPLLDALGDRSWTVRAAAIDALTGIRDARAIEPFAASPSRRFRTLQRLSTAGIRTGVTIAPVSSRPWCA